MTEQITSGELRSFVAANTGKRKVDSDESLELLGQAASQIDTLAAQVAELQQRVHTAEASATTPPPAEDPSEAAMLLLKHAQAAADETIAEAERLKGQAAAALEQAEANARVEADRHLVEARHQAQTIIAEAERQAAESLASVRQEALDIAAANDKARDRAEFIHRQYVEKAGNVRKEAEALVEFSRQVETLVETDMSASVFPAPEPAVAEAPAAGHARPQAPEEPEPAGRSSGDTAAASVVAEAAGVIEEAAATPATTTDPAPAPAPTSQFLPPPPPPPAPADVLDLNESDLEAAVDTNGSIDEELFGDDGDVIDLRDNADAVSEDFQFFGRDS